MLTAAAIALSPLPAPGARSPGGDNQRALARRLVEKEFAPLYDWVQLPNMRECRGVVRWAKDNIAGLELIDILSVNELGALGVLGRGMN